LLAAIFLLRSHCSAIAFTLQDVRGPTLTIVCEPCGRRGRYSVERLMAEHGDAKLTSLATGLADCPKARVASIYDRCRVYETLAARLRSRTTADRF
jgi:hypothetical protein